MDSAIGDRVEDVVPTTDSARRVVELVKLYGKGYVAGELSADRGMAITGSEIPAICSENRFEDCDTCFFNKIYGKKQVDNEYTRHGRDYEPVAINKFKRKTGARVFFVSFMRSEKYPFMGGTFDFLAIMPDGEGVLGEVKCPLKRSISDCVPPQYVGQVQTYLEIADLQKCLFVQYKPPYATPVRRQQRPEKLVITTVYRDPRYFLVRMPTLWEFWVRVCAWRSAILPLADSATRVIAAAWRVRKLTTTYIKAKLVLCDFRRIRLAHAGLYDLKVAEMEECRPEICDQSEEKLVIDCSAAGGAGCADAPYPQQDPEPMRCCDPPAAPYVSKKQSPVRLLVHMSAEDMSMGACMYAVEQYNAQKRAAEAQPLKFPSPKKQKQ